MSTKATSSVHSGSGASVATKAFADGRKMAYNVQVLWDGTVDLGYNMQEVYFPPDQQTINEGTDAVNLNMNGMIYGDVTPMATFSSGVTIQK